MTRALVISTLFLIYSGVFAKSHTVYSPDQGVLCDKRSGFCADSQGISMAYTEQFLGKKAAAKLLKIIGSDSDMTSFTMSNGVHCETKQRLCVTSKTNNRPDAVANGVLFKQ